MLSITWQTFCKRAGDDDALSELHACCLAGLLDSAISTRSPSLSYKLIKHLIYQEENRCASGCYRWVESLTRGFCGRTLPVTAIYIHLYIAKRDLAKSERVSSTETHHLARA